MLPRIYPGRFHVAFGDHRLVADAGLILPAILDCPDCLTGTWTWAMRRVEPTPATR